MIHLVAYTPEPLMAIALEGLVARETDIALAGAVSCAEGIAEIAASQQPDVALVMLTSDIDWGVLTTLRKAAPAMNIVLWVQDIATEVAHQALHLGVRGVLRRTLPPDMVLKCVRKVAAGELWFEKALTDVFLSGRQIKLSNRESQLVRLLAQGLKNKEIATELGISEGTIKVYLSKLYDKVGAKDRFELALFGLRNLQCGMSGEVSGDMPTQSLFVANASPAPKPSGERPFKGMRIVA